MVDKWIQKSKAKEGALSQMLGIPLEENIPFTLLEEIRSAELGETITNPTESGKKRIKITKLLKERVNWALNVKRSTQ